MKPASISPQRRYRFPLALALLWLALLPAAQSAPKNKELLEQTGLKLELIFDKDSYRVGEPIPVTLRFTYTEDAMPVHATDQVSDGIHRFRLYNFSGKDQEGNNVRDPQSAFYSRKSGSSYGITRELSPGEPFEKKGMLNEWLAFDQPGTYEGTPQSGSIIRAKYEENRSRSLSLNSEPVTITITEAKPGWVEEQIARAAEQFASPSSGDRVEAMRRLRFLLDERAITLLIQGLDDAKAAPHAAFGLLAMPDADAVMAALKTRLEQKPYPTYRQNEAYVNALAGTEIRQKHGNLSASSGKIRHELDLKKKDWQKVLRKKNVLALEGMDPLEAAPQLVELISNGALAKPTIKQKKIVLKYAGFYRGNLVDIATNVIANHCTDSALKSDLAAVVEVRSIDPGLRSEAILNLHGLGDNRFRDLIVEDLISTEPKLRMDVYETLGDYRKEDIARALVEMAESGSHYSNLPKYIRNYGRAVTAEQLTRIIKTKLETNQLRDTEYLQALAIRSPEKALELTDEWLKQHPDYRKRYGKEIAPMLATYPIAQKEVRQWLGDEDKDIRNPMLQALERAAWGSATMRQPKTREQLPWWRAQQIPDLAYLKKFTPELLDIAENDPERSCRMTAAHILGIFTHTPRKYWRPDKQSDIEEYLPAWKEWAAKHNLTHAAP